jgi:hypothetical protein
MPRGFKLEAEQPEPDVDEVLADSRSSPYLLEDIISRNTLTDEQIDGVLKHAQCGDRVIWYLLTYQELNGKYCEFIYENYNYNDELVNLLISNVNTLEPELVDKVLVEQSHILNEHSRQKLLTHQLNRTKLGKIFVD